MLAGHAQSMYQISNVQLHPFQRYERSPNIQNSASDHAQLGRVICHANASACCGIGVFTLTLEYTRDTQQMCYERLFRTLHLGSTHLLFINPAAKFDGVYQRNVAPSTTCEIYGDCFRLQQGKLLFPRKRNCRNTEKHQTAAFFTIRELARLVVV